MVVRERANEGSERDSRDASKNNIFGKSKEALGSRLGFKVTARYRRNAKPDTYKVRFVELRFNGPQRSERRRKEAWRFTEAR